VLGKKLLEIPGLDVFFYETSCFGCFLSEGLRKALHEPSRVEGYRSLQMGKGVIREARMEGRLRPW
jgi:hypothetical protein